MKVAIENYQFRDEIYSYLRAQGIEMDIPDSNTCVCLRAQNAEEIRGKVKEFLTKLRTDKGHEMYRTWNDLKYRFRIYEVQA